MAEAAIRLAETNHYTDYIAQALWLKAQSLLALNRLPEAARSLQQATTHAQHHNTPIMQVSIALDAVAVHLRNFQRDLAREQIDLAIALGRELGDPGLLQKVWADFGHVRLLFGEAEQASHAFEEALRLTSPEGFNLRFLARILRDYGVAQCYLGRYNDAESMFETAKMYLAQEGDNAGQWYIDVLWAGELLFDQEQYEPALARLDQALAHSTLDRNIIYYIQMTQAAIAIRQKRYDDAHQRLTAFHRETSGNIAHWYRPIWHLRMGELALATDRYQDAVRHAYNALGSVGTQSDLRYLTPTYCLLAVSLFGLNNASDTVMDALQRAIKTGRTQARRLHLAQALRLTGNYTRAASSRQTVRARSAGFLFESSFIFEEMGLPSRNMWADLPAALV